MTLAFYRVDNSKDYDRHTFDNMSVDEAFSLLNELSDDEFRVYDLDHSLDALDLENDYNDEILDGGWWVAVLL